VGLTNFDAVQAAVFIGPPFPSQGKTWFVRPGTGRDDAAGTSPRTAFRTLTRALAKATANQNDTVYLMAESNTAANTTDYQPATLNWNKDGVHLIGCNAGPLWSQRSRVAFVSTYVTAAPLFILSANGCLIQGIDFWAGVASANPTGCLSVTGQRNVIRRCQIAGMGASQMDIAGAYSLQISGGQENLFEDCTIGQDTVTLGAAVNAVIYFAAGAARNYFRNCRALLYTNHATNCQFLRAPAGSLDRYQWFEDCQFVNAIDSGSTNLTEAMTVAPGGGGILLLGGKTGIQGATDWNSADTGNVTAIGGTVASATYGLGVDVTQA
jgi:hypothetical protein